MIEPSNDNLSIKRQCRLLSISRSGLYYDPKGESPLNLQLMCLIDEQFLRRDCCTMSYLVSLMEKALYFCEWRYSLTCFFVFHPNFRHNYPVNWASYLPQ